MRLLGHMLAAKPSFPVVDRTHLMSLRLEENCAVHDRMHGIILFRQPLQ